MSVVNQMLQDIDRRRAAAGADALSAHADIRGLAARAAPRVRNRRWWLLGCVVVLCAAVIGMRWVGPARARDETPISTVTRVATPVVAATGVAPPDAPPPAVAPVIETASAAVVPPARRAVLVLPETLKLSLKLSALVADAPIARVVTKRVPAAAPSIPATTTITSTPVRQVVGDETIAAARGLWNDGARPAALTTLRDALAAAEAARNGRAVLPLARELARLEVADNRAQVGLDLLKRLENTFGDDADAWALRGNAEQRLGLHTEAAQSYLAALRLRPAEGRWMLGAAISLGASGRLDEAQTWVERARERDAITPTIAAYLQQLGIPLRK